MLSKTKSTKTNEICQNFEALVPNDQPRLSQALLSLSMYCTVASKGISEDLSRLVHGISYTQTMFIKICGPNGQTINHRIFRLTYQRVKWLHTFSITLTGKTRMHNELKRTIQI